MNNTLVASANHIISKTTRQHKNFHGERGLSLLDRQTSTPSRCRNTHIFNARDSLYEISPVLANSISSKQED